MKQKVRRALAVSGIAIAFGAASFGGDAFAATREKNGAQKEVRTNNLFVNSATKNTNLRERKRMRSIIGTVATDATEASFTLKKGDLTYTINIENAKIVNKKRETIAKTDIKAGDRVRIRGTVSGNTITATLIRDISLPRS
jgi:hypothetical protein